MNACDNEAGPYTFHFCTRNIAKAESANLRKSVTLVVEVRKFLLMCAREEKIIERRAIKLQLHHMNVLSWASHQRVISTISESVDGSNSTIGAREQCERR